MYSRLKLYNIDDNYVNFLKKRDSKVPDNYSGKRAYVGILISINGRDYFAPLTSDKQKKYLGSKKEKFHIIPLISGTNYYGALLLNNMIPVDKSLAKNLNYKTIQDQFYANLISNQINLINSMKADIVKNANKVYRNVCVNKNSFYISISCDFANLELILNEYMAK